MSHVSCIFHKLKKVYTSLIFSLYSSFLMMRDTLINNQKKKKKKESYIKINMNRISKIQCKFKIKEVKVQVKRIK